MTEKKKLYVDIEAYNNKNRAKTEYNIRKSLGTLANGYYESYHPYQKWTLKYTIANNTCICDKYDENGNHVGHSEFIDHDPANPPTPDFNYDLYDVIDTPGLIDEIDEV